MYCVGYGHHKLQICINFWHSIESFVCEHKQTTMLKCSYCNNFMFPNMHGMTHTKWVLHLLFSDTMYIWLIAMQSFFCTCLVQSCPVIVCHVQGLLLIQSMEVFQAWSVVLLFFCQQPLYAQSYCIVFDTRNPDYIATIIKLHSVLIIWQLSSNNYKKYGNIIWVAKW